MSTRFILVHGTCHGAWCWRDVLEAMASRGHSAVAVDLPGNGADSTDPRTVTMDMCVEKIRAAIDEFEPDDKIFLVGHSSGGFPIAAFGEKYPALTHRLIYLCAYVPRDGESVELIRIRLSASAVLGTGSMSAISEDGFTLSFLKEKCVDFLYHDCSTENIEYALDHLCPQPTQPQKAVLSLSSENFGSLPASYILCTEDRTIMPAAQEIMSADLAAEDVTRIESSHSPFFSCPDLLAGILCHISDGSH